MVCQDIDVRALGVLGRRDGSVYFPSAGFGVFDVVSYLVDSDHPIPLADNEVRFRIPVVEVVDVFFFTFDAPTEFQIDDRFESPTEIFASQGVFPFVHKGDIYRVHFLRDGTFLTFCGILVDFAYEVGLGQVGKIIA